MPSEQKVTRKLSAILSADVKGYSLLMADDEVHTIETLKKYRHIMSDLIQQHSGRVVDNPGDNVLAEFSSAIDAVECARQIQNRLGKENAKFVEDKQLQFRIGINIGDVAQDGGRIYGSGVNIAARIEELANPGGICISRGTYDQVKDKLDLGFEYLGEHEVKNIKEPVRVYRVLMDVDSTKSLVGGQLELPDKPSIAVLPFTNMSGDSDQEYFSDGLSEQIINGLCKVSNLFVIARNSSFAYKGKAISVKQIAKELGVRYILEGSVQKAGDRVRITAQLIDATTDFHMWSETYDRVMEDIFALQDEITMKVINAMEINLTIGEQARLWEGNLSNIQSYDKFARGLEKFNLFNKDDNAHAQLYFEQAAVLDSSSAIIHAWLGLSHLFDYLYNWSFSREISFEKLEQYTKKSLELNDFLDLPHIGAAYIKLVKQEYKEAIKEARLAVDLNPNGAEALNNLGFILCFTGEPEQGVAIIEKALRLNPIPPTRIYFGLGTAYTMKGDFEKGAEILKYCIEKEPNTLNPYLPLTACYIVLNHMGKARETVNKILKIDPNFSLKYFEGSMPLKDKELNRLYFANLRKAGLPD